MKRFYPLITAAMLLGLPAVSTAQEATPRPIAAAAKLTARDAAELDLFGSALAIDGDVAVVGSPQDDAPTYDAGSAYVFERRGSRWLETARLTAGDVEDGALFGSSVAISGDTLAVGAPAAGGPWFAAGAVYVFERDAEPPGPWRRVARLTASDAAAGDLFGSTVAIDGDALIVGAPRGDAGGLEDSGAAYVFERDGGWSEVARLTAADAAPWDAFASALAIAGETVLVGAPGSDGGGRAGAGAAYVFQRGPGSAESWRQVARLLPGETSVWGAFGASVALAGNTAAVGAPGGRPAAGAVHLFERPRRLSRDWTELRELTPAELRDAVAFGTSLALDRDTLIAGALDPERAGASPAAYVFQRRPGAGWSEVARLAAPQGDEASGFGNAVDVSAGTALVGAFRDDGLAPDADSGAVHVFQTPAVRSGDEVEEGRAGGFDAGRQRSARLEKSTGGHLIFRSAQRVATGLGGLAAMDGRCQAMAGAAGLDGSWMALLSASGAGNGARERLAAAGASGPFFNTLDPPQQIAADLDDLFDGALTATVYFDELGSPANSDSSSWTATLADGSYAGSSYGDWTSFDGSARVGRQLSTDSKWLDWFEQSGLYRSANLYCVQADPAVALAAPPEPAFRHTIFVSSALLNGDLGGIGGADATCRQLADAAGMGDRGWKAILSDSRNDARDRLIVIGPVSDTRGQLVANDRDDLFDGGVAGFVRFDEHGTLRNYERVWTGSHPDGNRYSAAGPGAYKGDWTSPIGGALIGENLEPGAGWLSSESSPWSGDLYPARLYCIDHPEFKLAFDPTFDWDPKTECAPRPADGPDVTFPVAEPWCRSSLMPVPPEDCDPAVEPCMVLEFVDRPDTGECQEPPRYCVENPDGTFTELFDTPTLTAEEQATTDGCAGVAAIKCPPFTNGLQPIACDGLAPLLDPEDQCKTLTACPDDGFGVSASNDPTVSPYDPDLGDPISTPVAIPQPAEIDTKDETAFVWPCNLPKLRNAAKQTPIDLIPGSNPQDNPFFKSWKKGNDNWRVEFEAGLKTGRTNFDGPFFQSMQFGTEAGFLVRLGAVLLGHPVNILKVETDLSFGQCQLGNDYKVFRNGMLTDLFNDPTFSELRNSVSSDNGCDQKLTTLQDCEETVNQKLWSALTALYHYQTYADHGALPLAEVNSLIADYEDFVAGDYRDALSDFRNAQGANTDDTLQRTITTPDQTRTLASAHIPIYSLGVFEVALDVELTGKLGIGQDLGSGGGAGEKFAGILSQGFNNGNTGMVGFGIVPKADLKAEAFLFAGVDLLIFKIQGGIEAELDIIDFQLPITAGFGIQRSAPQALPSGATLVAEILPDVLQPMTSGLNGILGGCPSLVQPQSTEWSVEWHYGIGMQLTMLSGRVKAVLRYRLWPFPWRQREHTLVSWPGVKLLDWHVGQSATVPFEGLDLVGEQRDMTWLPDLPSLAPGAPGGSQPIDELAAFIATAHGTGTPWKAGVGGAFCPFVPNQ